MEVKKFLEVVHLAEQLKNNTRHSWTSSGRHESVAEHSWRLCFMAYLVRDEFPEADMDKVLQMCLFHDIGEAFTGDIPAFDKTSSDAEREKKCVEDWIISLPEPYRSSLEELFEEMEAMESVEARIYKALDKMEAVIQHDEAELSSWILLEYDLQFTYGRAEVSGMKFMERLKLEVDQMTQRKIEEGKKK